MVELQRHHRKRKYQKNEHPEGMPAFIPMEILQMVQYELAGIPSRL
jgi:hypothetical protein